MEELYRTLGYKKCVELTDKYETLWSILDLSDTRKSAQVGGVVLEGVAKDFIREFLPKGLGIKSGLVFDTQTKKMSPQIDGIIYSGVPLLEFTDAVVVEKEQVKAILEIKSWVSQTGIFGEKSGSSRDPNTGLAYAFAQRRSFLPLGGKYIFFTFELHSGSADADVLTRLKEVCNDYAVIIRWEPKKEQKPNIYNFDNSVSWLIE